MSEIYGVWSHAMPGGSMTQQTIRDDGSYETHMVFASGGGCRQHIYHYGRIEIGETSFELHFESGKTEMVGCDDSSKGFAMRDFTEAETEEAKTLLAHPIAYTIEDDALQTTVSTPMGEMKVVYQRGSRL